MEASGESKPQARLLLFFKHNTMYKKKNPNGKPGCYKAQINKQASETW